MYRTDHTTSNNNAREFLLFTVLFNADAELKYISRCRKKMSCSIYETNRVMFAVIFQSVSLQVFKLKAQVTEAE